MTTNGPGRYVFPAEKAKVDVQFVSPEGLIAEVPAGAWISLGPEGRLLSINGEPVVWRAIGEPTSKESVVGEAMASPGPWRFEEGPAYESDSIRDANGNAVVMAHVVDYECPHLHMSAADAALIVDAWQLPQLREDNRAMLALLREVVGPCPHCDETGNEPCPLPDLEAMIRALLAKLDEARKAGG